MTIVCLFCLVSMIAHFTLRSNGDAPLYVPGEAASDRDARGVDTDNDVVDVTLSTDGANTKSLPCLH
jgi:hypothetical protein